VRGQTGTFFTSFHGPTESHPPLIDRDCYRTSPSFSFPITRPKSEIVQRRCLTGLPFPPHPREKFSPSMLSTPPPSQSLHTVEGSFPLIRFTVMNSFLSLGRSAVPKPSTESSYDISWTPVRDPLRLLTKCPSFPDGNSLSFNTFLSSG